MIKYQKYFPIGVKIALYMGLLILVVAFAVGCLIDELPNTRDPQSALHIASIIGMTLISFVSLLYSIVQDILRTRKEHKAQPIFTWEHDIPFTDREELLEETLEEIAAKIADESDCLQKNMRFGRKNGKKSFATRLCMRLQDIKYKREGLACFPKEATKKSEISAGLNIFRLWKPLNCT